jgi:hypothetical protein
MACKNFYRGNECTRNNRVNIGRIVFYVARFVSNESRRLVLPRILVIFQVQICCCAPNQIKIVWYMRLCISVYKYQLYWRTCCLHLLPWTLKLSIPPKQDGIHHRESLGSQNASNTASIIMLSIMNYFPHISLNTLNIENILDIDYKQS